MSTPVAEFHSSRVTRVPSCGERIGVMHLIDSLAAGGAERVAVNLANSLSRERYRVYLCTTRQQGPLADLVADDVGQLHLQRKHRFDFRAVDRLVKFIRRENIKILHAHSSSLLVATMASLLAPDARVIWHDHFGRFTVERRREWMFRLLTRRVSGVVAVSGPLADWSRTRLRVRADRVWYVPNFACETNQQCVPNDLPGAKGRRIVCVANLRPEKDHVTLVHAMQRVVQAVPDAHLLVVGGHEHRDQVQRIQTAIQQANLDHCITLLGPRRDVSGLLRACDIGVLSSASEGLPLSLLEYGLAGLPVLATDVGQCAEVLDRGKCGHLVPSRSPEVFADRLIALLQSDEQRRTFGTVFCRRVREHYSAEAAVCQLDRIYSTVLNVQSPDHSAGLPR